MERLTESTVGCFVYDLRDFKHKPNEFNDYDAFFAYSMAVRKLGEYEETGLEPEEINKLKADYDRLNDFEQSQIITLMQKNSKLEAKIKDLKALVAPRLPY